MRELAIGDIHGCARSFSELLEILAPQKDDIVILLGDYIDRGPDTFGVIEAILELSAKCTVVPLKGNHELMLQWALQDPESQIAWLKQGGRATMDSYQKRGFSRDPASIPERHCVFLFEQTLDYWETDERIFVHASVDPQADLVDQGELKLFWEHFSSPTVHKSGKTIVCGHTSQKSGRPAVFDRGVCIDTWAFGNGWLTGYDTAGGTFTQTNERGEQRSFTLQELLDSGGALFKSP